MTPSERLAADARGGSGERPDRALPVYVPPDGDDEPLDDNEMAFVRALVRIIVREIREDRQRASEQHEPEAER